MLDRTNTNSTERVTQLVRQLMARRSINQSVGYDDVLSERGLSSLDMVNLMLGVEAEFDLTIPQCEITPDNFRSVQMIERMIARQLHAAA